jgi:hypothetical protein
MKTNEDVGRHLELIQAIVGRMAGNSFLLKGWSVTIAAALFALAAKDSNPRLAWIALLPGLAFWGLDAYYLRQERLYRCLYDAVRTGKGANDPFTLDASRFNTSVPGWFRTTTAIPVAGVHGVVVLAVLLVLALLG